MSIPVIAFFNNKGGVGKTSLVYHLAWMFAEQGLTVVAADLDAQANLTAAFLDEDELLKLWADAETRATIHHAVRPLVTGEGDVDEIPVRLLSDRLALLPGDMALSQFEDELAAVWPQCLDGNPRAFRVTSAFWRIAQAVANGVEADVVLIDIGPNLGSINRSALIAADHVVIPLTPDLFSLQGLKNLGPALIKWRADWRRRIPENPVTELPLPGAAIEPVGYVIMQHSVRQGRPVKSFDKWIARIPAAYCEAVLAEPGEAAASFDQDENCLGLLKHYRSLMPMAQEARKPMFFLKPADGAIGAHQTAVQEAYRAFDRLAREIAKRTHLRHPVSVG